MNLSRLINIMEKNEVMERCPDRRSKSIPVTHLVKMSEERVFTAYKGCANKPTPRSVKAKLPRSTLDGGAIEDVLQMASSIRIFPRIAGMADVILMIAVEISRMVSSALIAADSVQSKTLRKTCPPSWLVEESLSMVNKFKLIVFRLQAGIRT